MDEFNDEEKRVKETIPSFALETASALAKMKRSTATDSFFSKHSSLSPSAPKTVNVLYLTGETETSRLLAESLKRHQYKVTLTQAVGHFKQCLNTSDYDIALIDYNTNRKEGLRLSEIMKVKSGRFPVLVVGKNNQDAEWHRIESIEGVHVFSVDSDGAYLLRIPDKVKELTDIYRQIMGARKALRSTFSGLGQRQSDSDDEVTDRIDLTEVAASLEEEIADSKKFALTVLAGKDTGKVSELEGREVIIGRDPECQICLRDESISRFHAKVVVHTSGRLIIEDLDSTNGTYISGKRIRRHALREGDKILFGSETLIKFQKQDAIDQTYHDELYFSSTRDGLTGIYNRRFCIEKITTDLSYARRHSLPVSLLLFDVDFFKKVNDTYGHPTGDVVLKNIAETTSNTVRTEDILGRYGGEEFIIFALDTDHLGAQIFAERIRSRIAESQIMAVDGSRKLFNVTVSIGIAITSVSECYEWEQLVNEADANLYKAKKRGRNCIVSSELYA